MTIITLHIKESDMLTFHECNYSIDKNLSVDELKQKYKTEHPVFSKERLHMDDLTYWKKVYSNIHSRSNKRASVKRPLNMYVPEKVYGIMHKVHGGNIMVTVDELLSGKANIEGSLQSMMYYSGYNLPTDRSLQVEILPKNV